MRLNVNPKTKIPSKWNDFLLDSSNKDELFSFLTQKVADADWPAGKGIYITNGTTVISRGTSHVMSDCTHEEADSRIVVHIVHALQHGAKTVQVRTVDTDVLVILVGHFFDLLQLQPDLELCVAFGVGKDFCFHNINTISQSLGERIARALPVFHAFSGSDLILPRISLGRAKKVPGNHGKATLWFLKPSSSSGITPSKRWTLDRLNLNTLNASQSSCMTTQAMTPT